MHGKHHWMILACAIPLLLIFVLPLFGITKGVTWIAIGTMIIAHLVLMRPQHNTSAPGGAKKRRENNGCH